MITLPQLLTLSGTLFALSIAGIFLNRKNVILLLLCGCGSWRLRICCAIAGNSFGMSE